MANKGAVDLDSKDRIILANLVERIVAQRGGIFRLMGPVTATELAVLRRSAGLEAISLDAEQPEPTATLPVSLPAPAAEPPPIPFVLNDRLIQVTVAAKGLLCIDFGTAASKVGFSDGSGTAEPLTIGIEAGDPQDLNWAPSSVLIDHADLFQFGWRAEDAGRRGAGIPLRSFKSKLWDDPAALLAPALRGTNGSFTFEECLTSYLAYLCNVADGALDRGGHDTRVSRRYAMPYAYDEERRAVRERLGTLLWRGAILSDSLGDMLRTGVGAPLMRAALDAVADVPAPAWFFDEELPCIGEPVAAGSFAMREDASQLTVYMIVDIGAGTTDFCILCVKNRIDGGTEPIQIRDGSLSVPMAGDRVDEALLGFVEENFGPDAELLFRADARLYKERLFIDGTVRLDLDDGTPVDFDRSDFLADRRWKEFVEALQAAQLACFRRADQTYLTRYGSGAVRVVLTGGGAALPLDAALCIGRTEGGKGIGRERVDALPIALRDQYATIENLLPRLIVSLGGSFPLQPRELDRSGARTSVGQPPRRVYHPFDKADAGLDH